jgi:hypothetical protein
METFIDFIFLILIGDQEYKLFGFLLRICIGTGTGTNTEIELKTVIGFLER